MRHFTFILFTGVLFFAGCRQKPSDKLFVKLNAEQTGIEFTNRLEEDPEHNIMKYEYFYNGSGVAVGDLNGDGLADLFFTGNQTASKLYLNLGGLRFKDVTEISGVAGKIGWKSGANMADVNGDGLLDIFVCYSAFGDPATKAKQLFINQGLNADSIPRFAESAAAYGLDAPGTYTSQTAFFDYDLDGDLDMFMLNHANGFYSPFYNTTRLRHIRHPQFGNRLYRNDNNHFTDVSEQAGIYGSGINFGLGIAISDLNNDGWPDIMVSNDYNEQDFVYINNRNGSFREVCQKIFNHMSRSTMGLDIADYNNDLLPDVVTMDMLPETNYRQKVLRAGDDYDQQTLMADSGYGNQYSRNMLQVNRGFGADSLPVFSEIGQLAGVSNTDWSWASLFTDLDNDGWKDLFVTNGFLKDYTNMDFIKYDVNMAIEKARTEGKDLSTRKGFESSFPMYSLVKKMKSTKLSNYTFHNNRDLTFSNYSAAWGLDEESVSCGAAYADLDNDGDLELIVCNNNSPVSIFQNRSESKLKNNFIRIQLKGDRKNPFAIGAKVIVTTDSSTQLQEMYPVRGYQSSVDYVLNFGLGKANSVKEVRVIWDNALTEIITAPTINSKLVIDKKDAVPISATSPEKEEKLFTDVTANSGLTFKHKEDNYVDFKQEFLIPYQLSRQGPKLAVADVNADGLEDFYVGGAAGQPGQLILQVSDGRFRASTSQPWTIDAASEDVGAVFFDADGDGDDDLYVASGGNEKMRPSDFQDRLYMNDRKGNFTKAEGILPDEKFSGSCVVPADFDKDGDLDLFIGNRGLPSKYPLNGGNIILRNEGQKDGKLKFIDVTPVIGGKELFAVGMVSDAVWTDIDKDGWLDLVLAGDWMPLSIFKNQQGKKLVNQTSSFGLDSSSGWWCKLIAADIDQDGDTDLIAGNLGSNTQFRVSATQPMVTYVGDFNQDGRIDPVMTWWVQGESYPYNSRDELIEQMPQLNKLFLRYEDYANASITKVIGEDQAKSALKINIRETRSSVFINEAGKFIIKPLPLEAQFSMMNGILYRDFDGDGKNDIFGAGNFFPFRVQLGRCDASKGSLFRGNHKNEFMAVGYNHTGLDVEGDVRDMVEIKGRRSSYIVISRNNATMLVLQPANAIEATKK